MIVTGGRDRERERRQLGHLGLSDPTVFISSFDRLVLVGCALCEYEWIDQYKSFYLLTQFDVIVTAARERSR